MINTRPASNTVQDFADVIVEVVQSQNKRRHIVGHVGS